MKSERGTDWFTDMTCPTEEHHIMNGAERSKAEKYGLKVYLSHENHHWLHNTRTGRRYSMLLKAYAQLVFMAEYHDKELWMKEFHKDYSEYWTDETIDDVYGIRTR